jgi:lipopolysaccharide export system protein LptC
MARSAVQQTSAVPVVRLEGLSAEINQTEGLAVVTAPVGHFFIEENRLVVDGPVVARSVSGYSLDGNRIEVDINANRVMATDGISGTLPIGRFEADRFAADIEGRVVTMTGNVRLRITPSRARG